MTLRQYWRHIDLSQLPAIHLLFEQEGAEKASCTEVERKNIFAPSLIVQSVEEHSANQVTLLAQHYAVSLDALLLSCWEVLLWQLSGQRNLIIGLACNGRNKDEFMDALGLYTRFVPVETHLQENQSFEQVLATVHKTLLETTRRQTYFTWDSPPTNTPTTPLAPPPFFPFCFEYERWPAPFIAENILFSLDQRACCIEPFSLKLNILLVATHLRLELHYDPQNICMAFAQRVVTLLNTLLAQVLAQPQTLLGQLPPLTF
jgi:non-ribosomal peptide synthetase component F